MKRTVLSGLMMLILGGIGMELAAQTLTVDFPVRGGKVERFLDFYQAVRSDTALTLVGAMYNSPDYWVKIDSNTVLTGLTTGREYRLRGAEGIKLSKREYMPANGARDFRLFFEPVDAEDKYVSLKERIKDGWDFDSICVSREEEREAKYRCRVSGDVDVPTCSRIAIYLYDTTPRLNPFISVPVRNGHFEYELRLPHRALYCLTNWNDCIMGAWYAFNFFADNGEVKVKGSLDNDGNSSPKVKFSLVSGDTTTQAIQNQIRLGVSMFDDLKAERDSLNELKLFYTPEAHALMDSLRMLTPEQEELGKQLSKRLQQMSEKGSILSQKGKDWERRNGERAAEGNEQRMQFARQRNDFAGLYTLYSRFLSMRFDGQNTDELVDLFHSQYEPVLGSEPEFQRLAALLSGYLTEPGMPCPDFTAPDLAGVNHTLSQEIEGKIAIVNLWASWCGPCRRHSKELIPIYEKYKDRGFTIIGVARELGDTRAMESAIKKDGYTWLNMVELDDKNKIWQKYGTGHGAGSTFLVDRTGKIVAVNPEAAEVEKYLEENIK